MMVVEVVMKVVIEVIILKECCGVKKGVVDWSDFNV